MFILAALLLLALQTPAAPTPAAPSAAPSPAPTAAATPLPPELDLRIGKSTRLLVVSPHPDDEALGAAGLIARVHARGGIVKVLLVTSGDAFPEGVELTERIAHPRARDFRAYGTIRERETRAAMTTLGAGADCAIFLGYPDEGLCHLASAYLSDRAAAFLSPYSDRRSPPETEQLIRGVAYRGVDLRREIERVITDFAPTLLVLPHADDDHPDHCATHIFTSEALRRVPRAVRARIRVLHYLVHYEQWPLSPDAGTGATLSPPAGFPPSEGRWASMTLTRDEAAAKKRALLDYTSQMQVIGRFMLGFGRDNELYVEGDPESPPACWCDDGRNIAAEPPPPRPRGRRPGP